MKEFIEALPMVTTPIKGETLVMYLAASEESISVVLLAEKGKKQVPVYFVGRALQGAELEYPELEKLILALIYTLFTYGASSSDDSGAGLMLISPEEKEYTYALRFKFKTTNNEVEYEALLAGIRSAMEMKIKDLAIFVDSQLVANQVKVIFEARQPIIKQYLEKTKEMLESFSSYSMEHVRRDQNKKANSLSKLASMNFSKLAKEVLVEVVQENSIKQREFIDTGQYKKGASSKKCTKAPTECIGDHGDGDSFAYDPNPNSFNNPPNDFTHPPQPQYESYSCELCGNDSHYGYDCPPWFPLVYEQEPCYNQNYSDNFYPQNSQSYLQQYLCCENCGGPHETFQCQPMNQNYYEPNPCYNSNSSGFDQIQPPQYSVVHQPPQEMSSEMLQARENLMEAIQAFLKKYDQIPPKEKSMALLLAGERFLKIKQAMEEEQNQPENIQEFSQYWKPPTFYDDDDEESSIPLRDIISKLPLSVAITPDLPITNSLIMEDEHLNTILETESDKENESSVKDLNLTPSESEDLSDNESECDVPVCDDFSLINVYEEKSVTFSNPLFNSNDDFTSSDDESLSDKDVPEDNDIESKDSYVSNLDEPTLFVTPLSNDNEDECFDPGGDVDEIEFLLHRDPSKISVDSILEGFTDEPPLEENDDLFDLESKENEWKKILYDAPIDDLMTEDKVFDPGIHDITISPTYVRLPFEDRHYLSLTYVIRIFLPYFTYPVESPFLLSSGSEDTIFDPGIFAFHFSSLEPVASHRSGTFILDNHSIECDRLIGIGFVLDFVEFISFTFGDKEMILMIEAAHRTTPKSSNGETPFSLVYGSKAVVPIEISVETKRTQDFDVKQNEKRHREDLDILKERREIASIREAYYKQKLASKAEFQGKIGPTWEGPYIVKKAYGDGAYKLETLFDSLIDRTWNGSNLRKFYM
ncbi:pre-mRNA splicing Prp18-interacting factor [Tanacetum coccineum]|uniref:Pre-mRNA splicing Prp18-interacting factor n=1 Tax=Tanacetum coccineum TaxID=301880 RepID=A0ABQ5IYN7_9ASTR